MTDTQAILRELARVKALFQQQAIGAVLGIPVDIDRHIEENDDE